VNADRKYKLIRRYHVTDASVHDSQVIDDILTNNNTAKDVWADSAYRSAETEKKLQDQKLCEPKSIERRSATRPLPRQRRRATRRNLAFVHASNMCLGRKVTTWAVYSSAPSERHGPR
jgi:transposase, IS5 family